MAGRPRNDIVKKICQYGHGYCTNCDLNTRVSDQDLICVNDFFPKKSPDIMVILGNLPDDYNPEGGLESSDHINTLTNLIQEVFPSKTVGFTSAIKCAVSPHYIKQQNVNKCIEYYFKNLMRNCRAQRYIIMGAKAVNRIVGKSCAKGKLYDFQYGKFVTTELLYLVLETDDSKKAFMQHISVLFDKKTSIKKNFELNVLQSASDIKAAYKELKDAPLVACDIEASGLPYRKCNVGHRVLCCSFTKQDNQAFIFPLDSAVSAFETKEEQDLSWRAVKALLQNDSKKNFHYGKYDVLYFKFAKGIVVNNYCEDTLYIHYLLDERPPHGLKEVTNLLVPSMIGYDDELDAYKKEHKDSDPNKGGSYFYVPNRVLFPYCGLDTIATWKLYNIHKPQLLQNEKQLWVYENIMIPVNRVYMNMEERGIFVDRAALQEEGRFLQKQIADAQTKVIKYLISKRINANVNLNSTPEIAKMLLELGECKREDLTYSDLTKKYTCDDTLISKLIGRGSQVCKWISTFRKKDKLRGTYVDAALAKCDKNDRIHANFYLHIASTGRSSVKDPNVQNLPPYIRKFYRVKKGKLKFEFDYSQLELRLMACMSKDPVMLRMYHPDVNQDLHALTAAGSKKVVSMDTVRSLVMAGKIDDMIKLLLAEYKAKFDETLRKRFRRQAKSTNFHMIFQGMVDSLMLRINQDLDKNIREIIMEIERSPEKKDALMPSIQDLKDAKVKCVCNDCGHWSYSPFEARYSKEQKRMISFCSECNSFDIQSDAQEFFDAYFELYPKVKNFQQDTSKFLAEHGYVETVFGRRRHLPDIWSDNRSKQISASNAGSNQPIQSPGADMKFMSLIEADKALSAEFKDSFIDCEVHDSITGETTPEEAIPVYRTVRRCMEQWPEKFPWMLVPFPADCKIGFTWGDMTEIKSEEHLGQWLEKNKVL